MTTTLFRGACRLWTFDMYHSWTECPHKKDHRCCRCKAYAKALYAPEHSERQCKCKEAQLLRDEFKC